jgi:hypothetical protein
MDWEAVGDPLEDWDEALLHEADNPNLSKRQKSRGDLIAHFFGREV